VDKNKPDHHTSKVIHKKYIIMAFLATISLLVVLAVVAYMSDSEQQFIASGHPKYSPIMWKSGNEIIGAGPELVQMIFSDMDMDVRSEYTGSWDKVQQNARTGNIDIIVAAYKNTERESYMDSTIPYTVDPVTLFIKNGSTFQYNNWEDLIEKNGVTTVGESFGQEFDSFIEEKLDMIIVDTPEDAFSLLEKEDADYFVFGLYPGEENIAKNGLEDKIEITHDYITRQSFYITISKKSPLIDNIPEINELIEKYKKDGTINRLIEKYKIIYMQGQ